MAGSFGFLPLNGNPVPDLAGGTTFINATTGAGPFDGIDNPAVSHLVGEGALSAATPVRFVPVALRKGQTVTFDVDFTPGDLKLCVINAKGLHVAENDDSGSTDDGSPGTNDPRLQFTAASSGVFFIAVTGADRDYLGNFQFSNGAAVNGTFQLDIAVGGLPPRTVFGNLDDNVVGSSLDPSRVVLGGGDDTFSGVGSQPDIVDGGAGDDRIQPEGGDDVVTGGIGSDFLYAGPGNDVEFGGVGNDSLGDFEGNDQLYGGAGRDTIRGDEIVFDKTGNDLLSGGTGNDELTPGLGLDTVFGGAGIDILNYALSDAALTVNLKTGVATGQGADRIAGVENVFGSAFADKLTGDDGANFLAGNQGDDTLNGGLGNDTLIGFAGDDKMIGGPGIDLVNYSFNPNGIEADLGAGTVNGGSTDTVSGVENIIGTQFADVLEGSAAPNVIFGLAGNDEISGLESDDLLLGNEGNDYIAAGTGQDTLRGGSENDLLTGSSGDDLIAGENGEDTLTGGEGDDSLEGGREADLLFGDFEPFTDGGRDTLRGGGGEDYLNGGLDRDELTGGQGRDRFDFDSPSELGAFGLTDRITDFQKGLDRIEFASIDAIPATLVTDDAFSFRGKMAFSGQPGELRYFTAGGETIIEADTDGDTQPNFDLVLTGTFNLGAGDFLL